MASGGYLGALPPWALGAMPVGRGGGFGGYGGVPSRFRRMMNFAAPMYPGVQQTDAAILPVSFPTFSFALATGTNTITNIVNPQTPFRGQRITSVIIRNGTSAALTAPLLSQLLVGPKPVILTSPGVALETFSQASFDTNLILPPTYPGMTYSMALNLTAALTTTDTLLALVSIIGSGVL